MSLHKKRPPAFTLIELLVVIAIIIILAGLLFPAYQAVQNQAKRTQAKNDLTQIITAVNAFYTEYGRYPTSATTDATATYGPAGPNANQLLFAELRACTTTDPSCSGTYILNTRQIVFISPPTVKDPANPRSGIATQATTINGISVAIGDFVDPWGTPYNVEIDGDYNNSISANPYGNNNGAGPSPLAHGVIAWSLGRDQALGTAGVSTSFTNSDDVISWQ